MIEDAKVEEFVLQGLDPVTATVCVEWRVWIGNVDRLKELLGPDCAEDHGLAATYDEISRPYMQSIGEICLPPIVPDRLCTIIGRRQTGFDDIPYMLHTNFELPLMLEGRKPFAAFSDAYPSDWLGDFLAPFDPFVESGKIVRRTVDTPMPHLKDRRPDLDGIRNVYFALPSEAWRIDVYLQLMHRLYNPDQPWSDDQERLEGSLLGYEDWQNDWWIERRVRRRGKTAE